MRLTGEILWESLNVKGSPDLDSESLTSDVLSSSVWRALLSSSPQPGVASQTYVGTNGKKAWARVVHNASCIRAARCMMAFCGLMEQSAHADVGRHTAGAGVNKKVRDWDFPG